MLKFVMFYSSRSLACVKLECGLLHAMMSRVSDLWSNMRMCVCIVHQKDKHKHKDKKKKRKKDGDANGDTHGKSYFLLLSSCCTGVPRVLRNLPEFALSV